ncbi:hypothetical protein Ddye_028999 [Dipteronia dyeriana]|uniref:Uncharacterized protein n=1 Tax=Dipteronia dyeriana TaxID=168575 RepID=A0AAD9TDR8_9ROSI|nr:hypothetical protein Ddye_028999 [Dipteronia dyeriana]
MGWATFKQEFLAQWDHHRLSIFMDSWLSSSRKEKFRYILRSFVDCKLWSGGG